MRQVYIVEPDDDLRTLLIDLLSDSGYSVRVMPSTHAALMALEAVETPSVVLIGYGVPSATDVEFLTRITALRRHISLLMSTNPQQLPAFPGARRHPIIIAEPFDIEELMQAVERAALYAERV